MISWGAVPTAAEYHIQVSDVSEGYQEVIVNTENISETILELPASVDDRSYSYRIRASDEDGTWSSWTPHIYFTTKKITEPEIIFPAEDDVFFDKKPVIRWENLSRVRGYDLN